MVEVKLLSDVMNASQNRVFTRKEWRHWIRQLDNLHLERRIDNGFIAREAIKMEKFVAGIPQDIVEALRKPPQAQQLKHDRIYALIDGAAEDEVPIYARFSFGQNSFIERTRPSTFDFGSKRAVRDGRSFCCVGWFALGTCRAPPALYSQLADAKPPQRGSAPPGGLLHALLVFGGAASAGR